MKNSIKLENAFMSYYLVEIVDVLIVQYEKI